MADYDAPDGSPPLVEELPWPGDVWQFARRLAGMSRFLFLDSAASGVPTGQYSFVTGDPFGWFQWRGPSPHNLSAIRQILQQFRIPTLAGLPPFQGGVAGLLGYEAGGCLERLPRARCDEFRLPDTAVGIYDWVAGFDHQQKRAWLISTGFPRQGRAARRERAAHRIEAVKRCLLATTPPSVCWPGGSLPAARLCPQYPLTFGSSPPCLPHLTSNFTRAGYLQAVGRAIEYIHAGDCFQVNLCQRLLHPAARDPLDLYGRLRERNPAPFAGLFLGGGFALASASPERFLRVSGGQVEARPIKGTRPRAAAPEQDRALARELLASQKDRAENVMIVDLLRNDLGRVCQAGTIQVPLACQLESYRFVHHLVSQVNGLLKEGTSALDLIEAAFPGGSITGAPKIRAMQIIAELEPSVRGPYCGSLGYIGFDGQMDSNILIRTMTGAGGWIQFPVGGGIVADSRPADEYEETLHKAQGMIHALH